MCTGCTKSAINIGISLIFSIVVGDFFSALFLSCFIFMQNYIAFYDPLCVHIYLRKREHHDSIWYQLGLMLCIDKCFRGHQLDNKFPQMEESKGCHSVEFAYILYRKKEEEK